MSSLLGGATPTQVAAGEIFFEEGKWPIDHVEVLISHLIRACRRQEKNHGCLKQFLSAYFNEDMINRGDKIV